MILILPLFASKHRRCEESSLTGKVVGLAPSYIGGEVINSYVEMVGAYYMFGKLVTLSQALCTVLNVMFPFMFLLQ